jgi:hypothetical protein
VEPELIRWDGFLSEPKAQFKGNGGISITNTLQKIFLGSSSHSESGFNQALLVEMDHQFPLRSLAFSLDGVSSSSAIWFFPSDGAERRLKEMCLMLNPGATPAL